MITNLLTQHLKYKETNLPHVTVKEIVISHLMFQELKKELEENFGQSIECNGNDTFRGYKLTRTFMISIPWIVKASV